MEGYIISYSCKKRFLMVLGLFLIVLCNMLKNIGWSDYNSIEIWELVGRSTDFLFGEDLEAILY